MSQKIMPCLWFDTQAEEAANYYVSIFKNSKILKVTHYGEFGPMPAGTVLMVLFELDGQEYMALNAGPDVPFTEAISLIVNCEDQAEIDYLWDKLSEGGEEIQCGWLKDKYGLTWQITPAMMMDLVSDDEPARTERMMQALGEMRKLDIATLKRAYEQ